MVGQWQAPFPVGVRGWGGAGAASPPSRAPGASPTGAQLPRDPKSPAAPHPGRTPDPKGHRESDIRGGQSPERWQRALEPCSALSRVCGSSWGTAPGRAPS